MMIRKEGGGDEEEEKDDYKQWNVYKKVESFKSFSFSQLFGRHETDDEKGRKVQHSRLH